MLLPSLHAEWDSIVSLSEDICEVLKLVRIVINVGNGDAGSPTTLKIVCTVGYVSFLRPSSSSSYTFASLGHLYE